MHLALMHRYIPFVGHQVRSLLALLICASGTVNLAFAQDRLILRGTTSGRIIITGTVTDFVGQKITVTSSGGDSSRLYDAADLLEIQTMQVAPQQRAIKALAAGQANEAQRELAEALKLEDRPWMRREILALMVKAFVRLADYGSAGLRFKMLHDSDPATRHFKLVPLIWAPQQIGNTSLADARDWIARNDDLQRLLGASLLLEEPAYTESARKVLNELCSHVDGRLRGLAQAQLWRVKLRQGPPGDKILEQWLNHLESLPEELRGGPQFLLGRAHTLRREHDLAAAAYLWLPLVDDADQRLAARACLNAAEALGDAGRAIESQNLLREIVARYPDTPSAGEAEDRLRTQ